MTINLLNIKIMKILQKITLMLAFAGLFASCQSKTDLSKILSKPETRKVIMDTIANNSDMSAEMVKAFMSSEKGKLTMMGNHKIMMEMMDGGPAMMKSMMSDMMEIAKQDTTMMSGMCKSILENKPMMDRIEKMKNENRDMDNMQGINKMNNTNMN
jgi:hypothetical protein